MKSIFLVIICWWDLMQHQRMNIGKKNLEDMAEDRLLISMLKEGGSVVYEQI